MHLIADRLGWFEDDSVDVETILARKGESINKVTADAPFEMVESDLEILTGQTKPGPVAGDAEKNE